MLGVGSQWVASRLKVPSILLLLTTGVIAGPVLGFVRPDRLLGDLILPLVSLCVAIVLFEGSLSLRLKDLKQIGRPLFLLLTVGVFITWFLCTLGARFILQFDLSLALLIGALLTVTGPTVVGPLLRHIRPVGQVGPIARWEGIVIDPIGAVLAVLVFGAFDAVQVAEFKAAAVIAVAGFLKTMTVGAIFGVAAAVLLREMLRRHWIIDHLQSPFALMLVVAAFTGSNLLLHESGLVTVTVMGVVLANQHAVSIRHIIEFKENLSVLLISSLFILLSARLDLRQFHEIGWRGPAFVAFVILVARPASVMLSTVGCGMKLSERLFLSWLAPRGIVAAAVASVFALQLGGNGSEQLITATFLVIVGTVVTYGLTAGWVANRLGLSVPNPQGVLIGGAHPFARSVAEALKNEDIRVCLIDRNPENLKAARMLGVQTFYADILSEAVNEELDLGGIGRYLAMTPNDEVNSLSAGHFVEVFGRAEVYRLSSPDEGQKRREKSSELLDGRVLFANDATYSRLDGKMRSGFTVKATPLTDEFSFERFRELYGPSAVVLFAIDDSDRLTIMTADREHSFRSGQTVIALVSEVTNSASADTSNDEQPATKDSTAE